MKKKAYPSTYTWIDFAYSIKNTSIPRLLKTLRKLGVIKTGIFILLLSTSFLSHAQLGSTDFVTTWKTDNQGLTNDSSITITTEQGAVYNYEVDWNNDGVFDTVGVTGDISHQYAAPGTYTVRIRGTIPAINFGGGNFMGSIAYLDARKLISIDQWGTNPWRQMRFAHCINMNITATDGPNLDSLQVYPGLQALFLGCTNLNAPLNHWDVSGVQELGSMFEYATSFNQNLGDWDLSAKPDLSGMLNFTALSTANYDSTLIGWYNQNPPDSLYLGAIGLSYCSAKSVRDSLIADGWIFNGDSLDCSSSPLDDFVTTWQAGILNLGNAADSMVFIPTKSGYTYNYNVDWDNDGVFDTLGVTGPINHKYNSQGSKTVRISGDYPALAFNGLFNGGGLISVDQWGNQLWKNMDYGLAGCIYLQSVGQDAPILDSVSSLLSLFDMDSLFNSDISHWDVSTIRNMSLMFHFARSFNQDLSNWDVSNVTNMGAMFFSANAFNQNLGDWDITSVQATAVPFYSGMWAMLDSTELTVANYDSTLIGWNNQMHHPNIGLGAAGLEYCLAKDARDSLIADGWVFHDDTLDPTCTNVTISEEFMMNILIYPNPNNGTFGLDLSTLNEVFDLAIMNIQGQLVYAQKTANNQLHTIVLNQAKGVYILSLNNENGSLSKRVIVH